MKDKTAQDYMGAQEMEYSFVFVSGYGDDPGMFISCLVIKQVFYYSRKTEICSSVIPCEILKQ